MHVCACVCVRMCVPVCDHTFGTQERAGFQLIGDSEGPHAHFGLQ